MAVVVCALLIVIWLLVPTSKQANHNGMSHHLSAGSHDHDLALNLQHLRTMQQQGKTSTTGGRRSGPASVAKKKSYPVQQQQYQVRQNAPTTIYHADMPAENTKSASQDKDNVTGLSDHSAYASFANQAFIAKTLTAKKVADPTETLMSGELIPATLETAINSDLPGMVRAVTNRPAYSYTGHKILIPAGSRLIGQYSSMTLHGIRRIFVIWQRIILPSGVTVAINSPATDTLGQAGQQADVTQTHFMARFGQSVLLSMMGAAVANDGVSGDDAANSAAQYRTAVSQSLQQEAQNSVTATSSVKPTLILYQGSAIKVFVAQDVSFNEVNNA